MQKNETTLYWIAEGARSLPGKGFAFEALARRIRGPERPPVVTMRRHPGRKPTAQDIR